MVGYWDPKLQESDDDTKGEDGIVAYLGREFHPTSSDVSTAWHESEG